MRHADGHLVTDEEIADIYLRAYEVGEKAGRLPTFEVHVNMWSEHFGRVAKVAEKVETRGVPFRMTLDHSHVIFKIDNPEEQERSEEHTSELQSLMRISYADFGLKKKKT